MPYTPDTFSNFGVSSVSGGTLLSTATSLTLPTGDGNLFPATGPFMLLLGATDGNNELVKCTARSADTLTITRAQEGTAAVDWPSGTAVEQVVTAKNLTNLWQHVAWLPYSVKDYGALGDGSTDDTTALQAAIDAAVADGGGIVYFPTGNYLITDSLIVDHDRVSLVGGGEEYTTTITMSATADPTYALIVGNSKTLLNCHLFGITFQGRNDGTSTGGGIVWRSNLSSIKQVRVAQFGGDGIHIDAYTPASELCEDVLLDDVYLIQNGGDQLSIGTGVVNSEFIRVVTEGKSDLSRGNRGIYCRGRVCKFLLCHPYFSPNEGIKIDLTGLAKTDAKFQIMGGEYETNGGDNISIKGLDVGTIVGVTCYGGSAHKDLVIDSCTQVMVSGGQFYSPTTDKNVGVYSSDRISLVNNLMAQGGRALELDGVNYATVTGNLFDTSGNVMANALTYSTVSQNVFKQSGLTESSGDGTVDYNIYSGNTFASGSITFVGTHSRAVANPGFNPKAVTAPGVPASTTPLTNSKGVDCAVYLKGGTVSAVAIGATTTGFTSNATFHLPAGQTITLTYTVAPTWVWVGE